MSCSRKVTHSKQAYIKINFAETFTDIPFDFSDLLDFNPDTINISSYTNTLLYNIEGVLEFWDPTKGANVTITNGELTCEKPNGTLLAGCPVQNIHKATDFRIIDILIDDINNNNLLIGLIDSGYTFTSTSDPITDADYYLLYRADGLLMTPGGNTVVDSYTTGDTIRILSNSNKTVLFFKNEELIGSVLQLDDSFEYFFATADNSTQNSRYTVSIVPQHFPLNGEVFEQVSMAILCDSIPDNTVSGPSDSGIDSTLFNISLSRREKYNIVNESHQLTEPFLSSKILTLSFIEQAGTLTQFLTGDVVDQGILNISVIFKKHSNII